MFEIYQLFALMLVIASLLAGIAIWSRQRLHLKLAALIVALGFLPFSYLAMVDLLSRPKPVKLEWWLDRTDEATVIAGEIVEDDAIHLWLRLDQLNEPRAYSIPWNREIAQNLQDALRSAEENQSGVRMRLPFEHSWDRQEPPFYALPQPALPPKDLNDPPERYERPEAAA